MSALTFILAQGFLFGTVSIQVLRDSPALWIVFTLMNAFLVAAYGNAKKKEK